MHTLSTRISLLFPHLRQWAAMPALTGWGAMVLGIVLAGSIATSPFKTLYNAIGFSAILLPIFAGVLARRRRTRVIAFAVAGLLVGARADWRLSETAARLAPCEGDGGARVVGTVASVSQRGFGRYTFLLAADSLALDGYATVLRGGRILVHCDTAPELRARVALTGRFRLPRPAPNAGAFNEVLHMSSNGIQGVFYVDRVDFQKGKASVAVAIAKAVRRSVQSTASLAKKPSHRGLLLAAFLGEKGELDSITKASFRSAGIYHLLAISGLHVAILTGALMLVLGAVPVNRHAKTLVALVIIWGYLALIGPLPSLFRAVAMATVLLVSTLAQRRSFALNALGLAGIVWLTLSPHSLFTPGFQLSFAATLGIILLHPAFTRVFEPYTHSKIGRLGQRTVGPAFLVSLSGFLATAPVLAYHFGSVSIFGLIANVAAVTLMTVAMNLFFVAALLTPLMQPIAFGVMQLADLFLSAIVFIAHAADGMAGAALSVRVPPGEIMWLYAAILLGFAAVTRNRAARYLMWSAPLFLTCLALSLGFRHAFPTARLSFLSAAEGNISAIRFPNNRLWVISDAPEAGRSRPWSTAISPWLRRHAIGDFDAILMPRLDPDLVHTLLPLLERGRPANVVVCGPISDEQLLTDLRGLAAEFGARLAIVGRTVRYIPAPRCTVYVCAGQDGPPTRCAMPYPASVTISFGGVRVGLEGDCRMPCQGSSWGVYRERGTPRLNGGVSSVLVASDGGNMATVQVPCTIEFTNTVTPVRLVAVPN